MPRRHAAAAEPAPDAAALTGWCCSTCPTSTRSGEHRLEVDRLVELVDLLVWVLDPQKYADAALHDRYLRRSPGTPT